MYQPKRVCPSRSAYEVIRSGQHENKTIPVELAIFAISSFLKEAHLISYLLDIVERAGSTINNLGLLR